MGVRIRHHHQVSAARAHGDVLEVGHQVPFRGLIIGDTWIYGTFSFTYFDDVKVWKYVPVIDANVDVVPDTLKLGSKGQWITAYIQLPEGYNPEDIDPATILLNEVVQPVLDPKYDFVTDSSVYLVDHDGDGILERMVKFDRAKVMTLLSITEATLTLSGEINDILFEGIDTITVLQK